ncbi:hypothetical protein GGX14DRAFT_392598 [Mycena pura]|uniref:Uncharacterized protein n=1 Tax=Mycena pura TaxID=153505 RepID=A0AAD6VRZ1_9AGAR|nr:hypothetical protein GGX14DRAFT_392598 [Mycena pura]
MATSTQDFFLPLSPGTARITDFFGRLGESSSADAVVTDVSWWEQTAGLKHQVIMLRVVQDGRSYDIRLERAGKTLLNWRALDQATVLSPDCVVFDEAFFENHHFFCALLATENSDILPERCKPGQYSIFSWAGQTFTGAPAMPAFQDFVDHKWRGPPPTLRDVSRYLTILASRQPNYQIWGSNCFWLSRNLFHILALRHYSFPFLAFGIDLDKFVVPRNDLGLGLSRNHLDFTEDEWRKYDPSSIGLLFRFLHHEEWRNGVLMFRRAVLYVMLGCLGLIPGVLIWGFQAVTLGLIKKPIGAIVFACGTLVIVAFTWICASVMGLLMRVAIELLTEWRIREVTEDLVFEVELTLPPDSRRGDFIPPELPFVGTASHPKWRSFLLIQTQYLPSGWRSLSITVEEGERELPTPWEKDEQIYAPGRDDYEMALQKLRQTGASAVDSPPS